VRRKSLTSILATFYVFDKENAGTSPLGVQLARGCHAAEAAEDATEAAAAVDGGGGGVGCRWGY
jgi:hypothetical protein